MNIIDLINHKGPPSSTLPANASVTNKDLLEVILDVQKVITRLETRLCRYITHQGAGHILHSNPPSHSTRNHTRY